MSVSRGENFETVPLKIVGSSVYGLYDKMSSERTINMTISDNWLVPYPGYKVGISYTEFGNAKAGRGLYESVKLDRIVAVFDDNVYLINLNYFHQTQSVQTHQVVPIGRLNTSTGPVYISENNKPQILISDGLNLYVYDQSISARNLPFTRSGSNLVISSDQVYAIGEPVTVTGGSLPTPLAAGVTYYIYQIDTSVANQTSIQLSLSQSDVAQGINITLTTPGTGNMVSGGAFQVITTSFTPGYITFHDTYFIASASDDGLYTPPANNTWRLSSQNNGFVWANIAQTVGLLETKPDNTQAVVRFPSKGNMILVMGETVTEYWFDTGAQLFPYQRQNQGSIDYGCLNAATVAYMDEIVVWLARNEKSGPVIMYTTGGPPEKVTTDGIDYQLSEIDNPESAQGFLYRKNGHLFYHINFYLDNLSFVVDFTANKIYNACDQNLNYYSMGQVVWFKNQYFSISKDNGNLFIFDTIITTYDAVDSLNHVTAVEIPRIRVCDNVRLPSQDYRIINDIGFTIETGETDYYNQDRGPIYLQTQNDKFLVTEATVSPLGTQSGDTLVTEDGKILVTETPQASTEEYLIAEQADIWPSLPRVDLSISYDGGASFGADFPYVLNPIGKRKNRLMWWQCGIGNDVVPMLKFWGIGRFIATNGEINIRK